MKFRWLFLGFLGAGLLTVAGVCAAVYWSTPDFMELKKSISVACLDRKGGAYEREVGPQSREWVSLPKISTNLVMAVIASEDTTFFQHEGLDFYEIKQALKKDLKEKRLARGGSTLTQQLVKNLYLSHEKTFWRKFREMIWAYQLERVLSKEEILAYYLNTIEWGPGIYGIKDAAGHYFGVAPAALTPRQAAFLALLIPNPGKRYSYFSKQKLTEWANKRMDQILDTMRRLKFLEEEAYTVALSEQLWVKPEELPDSEIGLAPKSDSVPGETAESPSVVETPEPAEEPTNPIPPPTTETPAAASPTE